MFAVVCGAMLLNLWISIAIVKGTERVSDYCLSVHCVQLLISNFLLSLEISSFQQKYRNFKVSSVSLTVKVKINNDFNFTALYCASRIFHHSLRFGIDS